MAVAKVSKLVDLDHRRRDMVVVSGEIAAGDNGWDEVGGGAVVTELVGNLPWD